MLVSTIVLEKGLKAEFNRAMAEVLGNPESEAAKIKAIATEVPSTSNSEKYGFLGDLPLVREWLGDKEAEAFEDYDYTIKNKDWEVTVPIDRNELEDDQMGAIRPRIAMMPQMIMMQRLEMLEDLLSEGTTNLAYDGAAFFSSRAVNDNLSVGTGATYDKIRTDIMSNTAAMYNFKSDKGRYFRFTPDTIVAPVEMAEAVLTAIMPAKSETAYNPAANQIKNVIWLPGQTDTSDYYLLCTKFSLKPFILQVRKNPVPVLDDTMVKRNRKLLFSAEGRHNVGYGLYQMAIKVVNS